MTRRMSALLLAVVLATAACATDEQDGAEPTAEAERIGGRVQITAKWSGAEQEAFEKVLAAFTEQTGTRVTYTSGGDEIATVLRTAIEGKKPPQLAILPQPGLLNDLHEQKALKPIDDIVGDAVDESWAPTWRELGSVDDELYGVFIKGSNKSTMFYSVGAFEDAEVEAPEDWEAFKTAASTLSDSGVTPLAIGGEAGWVLTDWFENLYIRIAGLEKYDQLTTHEIPWTDESVIQTLATFGEILSEEDWILDGPTSLSFEESVDAVFRDEPRAAMVFEGDFVPTATDIAKAAEPKTDYDVFDFPSVEGSDPVVVGGGDVVVMLEETEQSRVLLEFLASTEAAEVWIEEGGISSPNRDVDPETYTNEVVRQTAQTLAGAETFRFDLSDLVPTELGGDVPGSMWSILQDFAEDASPENAEETAQKLEAAAKKAFG